jgi:hypothetical protein
VLVGHSFKKIDLKKKILSDSVYGDSGGCGIVVVVGGGIHGGDGGWF